MFHDTAARVYRIKQWPLHHGRGQPAQQVLFPRQ
jgi:hypothetical protein